MCARELGSEVSPPRDTGGQEASRRRASWGLGSPQSEGGLTCLPTLGQADPHEMPGKREVEAQPILVTWKPRTMCKATQTRG